METSFLTFGSQFFLCPEYPHADSLSKSKRPESQGGPESQGDHASCRPSWDTSGIQGAEGQAGGATEKGTLPEEPGHVWSHSNNNHAQPVPQKVITNISDAMRRVKGWLMVKHD